MPQRPFLQLIMKKADKNSNHPQTIPDIGKSMAKDVKAIEMVELEESQIIEHAG